jgi:hypothetical protein
MLQCVATHSEQKILGSNLHHGIELCLEFLHCNAFCDFMYIHTRIVNGNLSKINVKNVLLKGFKRFSNKPVSLKSNSDKLDDLKSNSDKQDDLKRFSDKTDDHKRFLDKQADLKSYSDKPADP